MELLGDFSLPFTLHIFALGRISLFARGHLPGWGGNLFCEILFGEKE